MQVSPTYVQRVASRLHREHEARLSLLRTENVGDVQDRIITVLSTQILTSYPLDSAEKHADTKETREDIKAAAVSLNEEENLVTKADFDAVKNAALRLSLSRFRADKELMKNSVTEDGRKKLQEALDGVFIKIQKIRKELKDKISVLEGVHLHISPSFEC